MEHLYLHQYTHTISNGTKIKLNNLSICKCQGMNGKCIIGNYKMIL